MPHAVTVGRSHGALYPVVAAGQPDVRLFSTGLTVLGVSVGDGAGTDYPLLRVGIPAMAQFPPRTARPMVYTVDGAMLHLYPTPDREYVVSVEFEDREPPWPEEWLRMYEKELAGCGAGAGAP